MRRWCCGGAARRCGVILTFNPVHYQPSLPSIPSPRQPCFLVNPVHRQSRLGLAGSVCVFAVGGKSLNVIYLAKHLTLQNDGDISLSHYKRADYIPPLRGGAKDSEELRGAAGDSEKLRGAVRCGVVRRGAARCGGGAAGAGVHNRAISRGRVLGIKTFLLNFVSLDKGHNKII